MTTDEQYTKAHLDLDNALSVFASENGDGFYGHDWIGAYDYQEDGFKVGDEALTLPEDERDAFIEAAGDDAGPGRGHLVITAARFRILDTQRFNERRANKFFAMAADITDGSHPALAGVDV